MKYVVCLPLLCVLTSALRIRVGLEEEDLGRLHDKESNKIISNSTADVTLRQKMLLDESQGSKDFETCWQFITHGCGYPIPIFLLNKCCKWCTGDKHWWPRCQKTKKAPTRAPTKSPTAASPVDFCKTRLRNGLKIFLFGSAAACAAGTVESTWHMGKSHVFSDLGLFPPGLTCGVNCFDNPTSYYYGSGFLQHNKKKLENRTRDQTNLRKNVSSQIAVLRDLRQETRDPTCGQYSNRITPLPNPGGSSDGLRRATFTYYFHSAHETYTTANSFGIKSVKIPDGSLATNILNKCMEVIGGGFAIFCGKPTYVWCDSNSWADCPAQGLDRTSVKEGCCHETGSTTCSKPYGW